MRVLFQYKNHKGVTEVRDVDVVQVQFTWTNHPEYGYQPGWAFSGYDYSRGRSGNDFRTFYLHNVILPDDKNHPFILMMIPMQKDLDK